MQKTIMPKNKIGGVVSNTVMGVGGLLIGVIIVLILTSTIIQADLFEDVRLSATRTNQLLNASTNVNYGYNTYSGAICTLTTMTNSSNATKVVPTTNYTTSNCKFSIVATSAYVGKNVNVTSTTTYDSIEEQSILGSEANFTDGIDNVSEKIPTILLIVAVVFLFGALVLLMRNSRLMGVGAGGSL